MPALGVLGLLVLALPALTGQARGSEAEATPPAIQTDHGGILVGSTGQEYVVQGNEWPDNTLTWGFQSFTNDLTHDAQSSAITRAFDTWAEVTPLQFTRVTDCGLAFNHPECTTPDIRIHFGSGTHSGSSFDPAFDGPGGVAAHAFYPPPNGGTNAGDVHFDDAETWRNNGNAVDLETIALHEIGHSLGLAHTQPSKCPNQPAPGRPLMCTLLFGTQRDLSSDDVNGIQAIYGNHLPPGVGLEVEQAAGGSVELGPGLKITVVNGTSTPITDPGVVVEGTDECDDSTLPDIAALSTFSYSCPLPADELLVPFTGSDTLVLTTTLTGDGIDPVVVGPEDLVILPSAHPFSDVPDWVGPSVDWIHYYGIGDGYENGTYRPNWSITRGQTVRMVHRLAGEPATDNTHPFRDVDSWVVDAVDWASDPDGAAAPDPLVTGYDDGTFRTGNSISRGQLVRLLYRFAGSPPVDGLSPHGFSDVPSWVADAVRWAAHDPDGTGPLERIAEGYQDGTFRPNADITRGQVTRMLHRLAANLDL